MVVINILSNLNIPNHYEIHAPDPAPLPAIAVARLEPLALPSDILHSSLLTAPHSTAARDKADDHRGETRALPRPAPPRRGAYWPRHALTHFHQMLDKTWRRAGTPQRLTASRWHEMIMDSIKSRLKSHGVGRSSSLRFILTGMWSLDRRRQQMDRPQ